MVWETGFWFLKGVQAPRGLASHTLGRAVALAVSQLTGGGAGWMTRETRFRLTRFGVVGFLTAEPGVFFGEAGGVPVESRLQATFITNSIEFFDLR